MFSSIVYLFFFILNWLVNTDQTRYVLRLHKEECSFIQYISMFETFFSMKCAIKLWENLFNCVTNF